MTGVRLLVALAGAAAVARGSRHIASDAALGTAEADAEGGEAFNPKSFVLGGLIGSAFDGLRPPSARSALMAPPEIVIFKPSGVETFTPSREVANVLARARAEALERARAAREASKAGNTVKEAPRPTSAAREVPRPTGAVREVPRPTNAVRAVPRPTTVVKEMPWPTDVIKEALRRTEVAPPPTRSPVARRLGPLSAEEVRGPGYTQGAASTRTLTVEPGTNLVAPNAGWSLIAEGMLKSHGVDEWWWATMTTVEGLKEHVAVRVQRKFKGLMRSIMWKTRALREGEVMEALPAGPWIKFYGLHDRYDCQILVFHLARGDLRTQIIDKGIHSSNSDLPTRVRLFGDLLDGLRILEETGWVHRRILPENLFVEWEEAQFRLKIGGFDHAIGPMDHLRQIPDDPVLQALQAARPLGMRPGSDPTVGVTSKTDVYFAGLVLYELIFDGALPMRFWQLHNRGGKWFNQFPHPWYVYKTRHDNLLGTAKLEATRKGVKWVMELVNILEWMLEQDESKRPTAAQAYEAFTELGPPLPMADTHLALLSARWKADNFLREEGLDTPDVAEDDRKKKKKRF